MGLLTFSLSLSRLDLLSVPQTVLSCLNIVGSLITALVDTPRTLGEETIKEKQKQNVYAKEIRVPDVWLSSYKEFPK